MKNELIMLTTLELQKLFLEESKSFIKELNVDPESDEVYRAKERFKNILEILMDRKEKGML